MVRTLGVETVKAAGRGDVATRVTRRLASMEIERTPILARFCMFLHLASSCFRLPPTSFPLKASRYIVSGPLPFM